MAQLSYQSANPSENTALLEIIFHSRTQEEGPNKNLLRNIFQDGQNDKVFGSFHSDIIINIAPGSC